MMNNRIKELADKSNAWYPMGVPSSEGGDAAWENLVIFEKEDLQKFAELIIKECLACALPDDYSRDDWFKAKVDVCSHIIEKFGLKNE